MIQRIQSLYLFLTTIMAVLFLSGNILIFSDSVNKITLSAFSLNRIIEGAGTENIKSVMPFSILLFVVPLLSFLTIFLYKNRKLQLRLVLLLIVLVLAVIAGLIYFTTYITGNNNVSLNYGVKLILPILMFVFSILAYRGIRKDDALVKSYDRLR